MTAAEGGNRPVQEPVDIQRFKEGGLILGVEPTQKSLGEIRGDRLGFTSLHVGLHSLEKRWELDVPERDRYFLDASNNRLILLRQQNSYGNSYDEAADGVYADIVNLNENGRPSFRTDYVGITPDAPLQIAQIGPNNFGLPASHIQEADGRIVSVRDNLARLVNWNWQEPEFATDSFDAFKQQYLKTEGEARKRADLILKQAFPSGAMQLHYSHHSIPQTMGDETVPVNIIIAAGGEETALLTEASRNAGFAPFIIRREDVERRHEDLRRILSRRDRRPFETMECAGVSIVTARTGGLADSARAILRGEQVDGYRIPVFSRVILSGADGSPARTDGGEFTCAVGQYASVLGNVRANFELTRWLRGERRSIPVLGQPAETILPVEPSQQV